MMQRIFYMGELMSEDFLNNNVDKIMLLLKERNIQHKEIIICKANTHLGVYFQWMVCNKLDLIPIFVDKDFSLESINGLNINIGVRLLLESTGTDHYVHVLNPYNLKNKIVDEIESGSIINLTSATTGNPKLVLRSYSQLEAELERYSKYLKIDENDVILPIVPINHSFGFISGLLLSIKVNATLVLPDVILPRNIIQLSHSTKATMMLGVPYFYRKMISVSEKYNLNEELRYIIASGEPMEENLQTLFFERFEKKLLQQYGSTETGSLCIGGSKNNYKNVGKPLPNVGIKIINDEEGRPCVYVFTPLTIGSYITRDNLIKLNSDYYKMGDMGKISSDGEIELLGRVDDVLIVGGKKVNKKRVTSVLKRMDGIHQISVYLEYGKDIPELVCEYCSDKQIPKNDFVNHCKSELPFYQIPKRYYKVEKLKHQDNHTWKTAE